MAARALGEADEKAEVVERKESVRKGFARHGEVPKVGAVESLATFRVTIGIERAGVPLKTGRLEVHLPLRRGPRSAVPRIPSGSDAVEKVASSRDRLQEVVGISDPHQVPWPVPRKLRVENIERRPHLVFCLTHRKAADSESVPVTHAAYIPEVL
jgi:hypothetical protein